MIKNMKIYHLFLSLSALDGCATLPTGPSVMALPGDGKSFEQFQTDDAVCRQWAGRQIGLPPQAVANQNTATGAIAGTAIGAAIGAASGNAGAGANAGQASGYEAQRRYDIAYQQCMYAKGNQIPRVVRRVYRTYY